jgi:hypothetical protein
MCSGAEVAGGFMGAGLSASTVGAYKNAAAQKSTLEYEAAVARNNAQVAQYQAQIAQQDGVQQEQTQELKNAATMGDQRAALAANGVDLGEGSANEILATTKFMGTRDALQIADNYARQAWAIQEQGKSYTAEANADTAAANAINPNTAALTSFLSGAGMVASSWYKYNKAIG